MTETKIISFRVNTDFADKFTLFCTRNKLAKKDVFTRVMDLIFKAEKHEKEDLPILNVPSEYQPLINVSMDRRDQEQYKKFKTEKL